MIEELFKKMGIEKAVGYFKTEKGYMLLKFECDSVEALGMTRAQELSFRRELLLTTTHTKQESKD